MHALVYTQPKELQLQERPMPEADAGEVVLRIEAVGICGSDLHAWHGHDPRRNPGLVLGHEFVGEVVRSAAPGVAVGTRFTGNPLITCGVCEYCVQGRNNLCSNRTMVGMTRPGAYAEYMSIPASSLIEMPQDMDSITASLTEPAATAWHAINLSLRALVRPVHECRVLVIGGGAIGMLAALLLKALGVRSLVLTELNALRRDAVRQHVGCEAVDPRESPLAEGSFDYVFDAVGAKPTRQQAIAAVKPGGVVMHVGLQDWASEIDMRRLTLAEITLLGTYTYTTADLRATVAALHGGTFGDLSWVEQRALADGPAAFHDLDQGRSAAAKIVLRP
ncbi:MAG: alcohol dehydrogenase catalytic domain-containing protein [Gammaproteobacteria bacterium]|nr:alcohol dehydrogenase catalytic domain-containing protein [Gammaproteobacteria bacterium]MBU1443444.1 alcohol dehydrogenase catalytic domain-containing protein [Gammaproteobacteria bacterium]MBU2286662.1 alcohol dehydrogenase catalytic domain-containing protein [Gammaproteobacteria bacterium]MBU2407577.1 alcohol dehydrogenase catalytic domain-containing protein [Gammaproteobacteria bacterium]